MESLIDKLASKCWSHYIDGVLIDGHLHFDHNKFAELILKECGVALSPMLRDMISRGQAVDLINKHFRVEE